MTFADFLRTIWKSRGTILLAVLFVAGVTVFAVSTQPRVYKASVTSRVGTPGSVSDNTFRPDSLEYLERLQNTAAQMATSNLIRGQIERRLDLDEPLEVAVELRPNTELVRFQATTRGARTAAAAANLIPTLVAEEMRRLDEVRLRRIDDSFRNRQQELATEIEQRRRELEAVLGDDAKADTIRSDIDAKTAAAADRQLRHEESQAVIRARSNLLEVVVPARVPSSPSGPNLLLALGLAGVVGLILGIGISLVFDRTGGTVATPEEAEALVGIPLLGAIPKLTKARRRAIGAGAANDPFHRLGLVLMANSPRGRAHTLLVTAPVEGSGSSTVAAGLAGALAELGGRTLIVDANSMAPRVHELLELENSVGLTQVSTGQLTPRLATQRTATPNLSAMVAGDDFGGTLDVMIPAAMRGIVQELSGEYDVIIIDSPAVLGSAHALGLAADVDAVLLVAAVEKTERRDLLDATAELFRVHADVPWVVATFSRRRPRGGSPGSSKRREAGTKVSKHNARRRESGGALRESQQRGPAEITVRS